MQRRQQGLKVAKLFGVELKLDASWPIIFALVLWSFSFGVIPLLFPDITNLARIVTSLAATFLLFLSVVTHEFAHALYAKRIGLKVDRITLFVFGGAAEIKEEPKTPRQEFIMAAAGPLTSILLSIIFSLIGIIGLQADIGPFIAIGFSLTAINLMLAIFNLLPGLPLDGGRMFRAIIWHFGGNFQAATQIAAKSGRILGYSLVLLGLFRLIMGNLLGGAWLILIGFFLAQSAVFSYKQAVARTYLRNKKVYSLMNRDFIEAQPDMTIGDFLNKYAANTGQSVFPLKHSKTEPLKMIFLENLSSTPLNKQLGEVAEVVDSLHPQSSMDNAWQILNGSYFSSLPVVDNGKTVGLLNQNQLQSYIANRQQAKSS